MGDDCRYYFECSRLFSNDVRRGAGVPVYQANLELFLMLPIKQLLKYRTQVVSIVVMASLQNVEMLLFRRSKGDSMA